MAILAPSDEALAALAVEQPISVDSDAATNARAIVEIERWCRAHHLARVQENWLRTVQTGSVLVRRGTCYKPAVDLAAQRQAVYDTVTRTAADEPDTPSSVEILWQM